MPSVDAATPRRGERVEAFRSDEALLALLAEGEALAPRVDAALAGATLPSPRPYVKRLVEAAARLGPIVRGARSEPVEVGHPHVAAWRFDGPAGVAVTAVSVAGEAVDVDIPVPAGAVEVVEGARDRTLPAHSVRVWVPA